MKKVKAIYYDDTIEKDKPYKTGLVLELEDGILLYQSSTDIVQPFARVTKESNPEE